MDLKTVDIKREVKTEEKTQEQGKRGNSGKGAVQGQNYKSDQ